MSKHTFGVVIINHNEEKWISETIYSVVRQTKPFNEVVIIDNNSHDKSLNIACEILKEYNVDFIKYCNKENKGIFPSINEVIPKLKSDYLLFLSANDILKNSIASTYFDELIKFGKKPAVISGLAELIDENSRYQKKLKTPILSYTPTYIDSNKCKKYVNQIGYWFTGPTIMYRRDLLISTNLFNLNVMGYSDLLKAVVLSVKDGALYVPKYLAEIRVHDDGFFAQSLNYYDDLYPDIRAEISINGKNINVEKFIGLLKLSNTLSKKGMLYIKLKSIIAYNNRYNLLTQLYLRFIKALIYKMLY